MKHVGWYGVVLVVLVVVIPMVYACLRKKKAKKPSDDIYPLW